MIDRKRGDRVRLSKPYVDRHASATVPVQVLATPERHAAASGAEIESEIFHAIVAQISTGLAGYLYLFTLMTLSPECAVATADRAIAGGRTVRGPIEPPAHSAAVTCPYKCRHRISL